MTALVVGLGSIGRRHHQILTQLGLHVATVSRRRVGDHPSIDRALAAEPEVSYVVVATETHRHLDAVDALVGAGFSGKVLIEKPLTHRPAQVCGLGSGLDIAVGYNLRFHPSLIDLRAWTDQCAPLSVQVRAGQHLGQWRPGRDLSTTASAVAGSGGVVRDLSHELDYLLWLFGPWSRVVSIGGTYSELPIESDDLFVFLIEFSSSVVASVELNYLDSSPQRTVTAVSSGGSTITVDLVSDTLTRDGERAHYDLDRDDTYRRMHQDILDGGANRTACSLSEGMEVVHLIDAIERSATTREWVHR